ncbi:MAG: hypothetical protein ACK47B_11750 [Armatimonadota bacterium]
MSSRIVITNSQTIPVTVGVEPWGRDFTLLPDEEFSFQAVSPGDDFHFHAYWGTRDISLYANGDCEDVEVYQGDRELECGHNRHHRADREL